MEKYFRYKCIKCKNDIETYENVVMIADMTPQGPKAGKKFMHVDFYTIMKVVVFDEGNNKNFIMIGLDKDDLPFYLA